MTERQHAVSGPLACYANGFRQVLASLGYDKRRASKHLGLLVDLSGWLEDEGLAPAELIGPEVTQFLDALADRCRFGLSQVALNAELIAVDRECNRSTEFLGAILEFSTEGTK